MGISETISAIIPIIRGDCETTVAALIELRSDSGGGPAGQQRYSTYLIRFVHLRGRRQAVGELQGVVQQILEIGVNFEELRFPKDWEHWLLLYQETAKPTEAEECGVGVGSGGRFRMI